MLTSVSADSSYSVWLAGLDYEIESLRWSFPYAPSAWAGHPFVAQSSRLNHLINTRDRWLVELDLDRSEFAANRPPVESGPSVFPVSAPFQDLSGRDLSLRMLRGSDLSGANLGDCDLYLACCEDADLRQVNFDGARYHDLFDFEIQNTWLGPGGQDLNHYWRTSGILSSPVGLPVRFEELAKTPDVESVLKKYSQYECGGLDRESLLSLSEKVDIRLLVQWVAELNACTDASRDALPWSGKFLAWYWMQHGEHALRRLGKPEKSSGEVHNERSGSGMNGPAPYLSMLSFDGFDFRGKNLVCADLSGSTLSSCDLTGVSLLGADLRSADLSTAIGMTLSGLAGCWIDEATSFPDYVVREHAQRTGKTDEYLERLRTEAGYEAESFLELDGLASYWSGSYIAAASPIGEPVSYSTE